MDKTKENLSARVCSRRAFSASLLGTAVASSSAFGAPHIYLPQKRVLRVLGTHVTLQEELRKQAEKDLGIKLIFKPGGSASVLHQATARPESFDLYEQWSNSIRVLWGAGSIQPIDTTRIRYWNEINQLTKEGRLNKNSKIGAGDAPNKILFVQPDGSLGTPTQEKVSFLPYVHNVDSFGYDAGVVNRGVPYKTESWGWLLDEKWAGKVAVVNAPTIGLFDLALAAQAQELMEFKDLGNLSRQELDQLFRIMIGFRKRGHFRGIWNDVPASVRLMKNQECCIESMFSPATFDLRGEGVDCVYASPKEGFRAWHGVMCLSSATHGPTQDAAYEYMNWWLSGWPGAFIARQGYYISNPDRAAKYLSSDEWDYWYDGKPAKSDILGTHGKVVAEQGTSRDGGSYANRLGNIAVWNTVMNNYEYSLGLWNEFLSA